MTLLYVFMAIIAAYIALSVHDARQSDTDRQIDAFYQVEQKKSFLERNESQAMGWY